MSVSSTESRDGVDRTYVPGTHVPTTDNEFFQESVFLCWGDPARGLGGVHRIGHEVNRRTVNRWTAVFGPNGERFRWVDEKVPLLDSWRGSTAIAAGPEVECRFAGDTRWVIDYPEFRADLELHDFAPFSEISGAHSDWARAAQRPNTDEQRHWEAGSRITGTVRFGDREYEVDGLALRDQSYGLRDWGQLRNHRALVGSFGPELTYSVLAAQKLDDSFYTFAYLNRGGREEFSRDVEIFMDVAHDGLTIRGAEARVKLPGETLLITAEAEAGFLLPNREYSGCDTICRATCGDLTGFADMEYSINSFGGSHRPATSLGVTMTNGLVVPAASRP